MKSLANITTGFLALLLLGSLNHDETRRGISKNGMSVSWLHDGPNIHFEMNAPTDGWVTVGFNETNNIVGNYLLMGRIKDGKAEVVEHYTLSPGEYKPITALGAEANVTSISGEESGNLTTIRFTIPINSGGKYAKDLAKGSKIVMLLAYSRDDDFQHHSMMRTSVTLEL